MSTIQQIKNRYLHSGHSNMSDHNNVKLLCQMRPQKNIPSTMAQNSTTKQFNYVVRWKVILDMAVIEIYQIVPYRRLVVATYSGSYHSTIPDIVSPYHRLILHILTSSPSSSFPTVQFDSRTLYSRVTEILSLYRQFVRNIFTSTSTLCSTYSQILKISYDKPSQTVCPTTNPNITVPSNVYWLTLNSFDRLSLSLSLSLPLFISLLLTS